MGNCQAAEVATVVIQHPGGKVERVYWSISASRVMADNPGHYVAVIITAPSPSSSSSSSSPSSGSKHKERIRRNSGTHNGHGHHAHAPVKHLKLLRPDDTLLMGHVYRLVSFEEVVRKFETKRHAKLSRLTSTGTEIMCSSSSSTQGRRDSRKERQGGDTITAELEKDQAEPTCDKSEEDAETDELVAVAQALILSSKSSGSRPGQWRPALQSISEVAGT